MHANRIARRALVGLGAHARATARLMARHALRLAPEIKPVTHRGHMTRRARSDALGAIHRQQRRRVGAQLAASVRAAVRALGRAADAPRAHAVSALARRRSLPPFVADALAAGTLPVVAAHNLAIVARILLRNLHIDFRHHAAALETAALRASDNLGHAHSRLRDAKERRKVAREVVRVEEVFSADRDPERKHNLLGGAHDDAGDPAAHDDVQLILPRREGVGAAAVVDRRLHHREVELVV